MPTPAANLAPFFATHDRLASAAVDGFTPEVWRTRFADAVNHPVWILAHLTAVRRELARNLGIDATEVDGAEGARTGDACLPADRYPAPGALMEAFTGLGQAIAGRLTEADADTLTRTYQPRLPDSVERSIEQALPILISHEALHIGQLSTIRRIAGLRGITEVLVELGQANAPARG